MDIDVSLLVELGVLIATVVWVVARIKGTTDRLSTEIRHLSATISDLRSFVTKVEGSHGRLKERHNVLEGRVKVIEAVCEERHGETPGATLKEPKRC